MNKNIIITGGAGFIGSWLAEHLIQNRDANIVVIDDLSSGKKDNLENIKDSVFFLQADVSTINSISNLQNYIPFHEPWTIVHLAASLGVQNIMTKPLISARNNIRSTEAVLQLANNINCEKFIFASTSEVYGSQSPLDLREDDPLIIETTDNNPRGSYAASKILDEFLVDIACRALSIPYVNARLFNIVGPRQNPSSGMVLPTFINQALQDKPITVYGEGKSSRTYTSVYDCIDVFDLMIHEDIQGPLNVASNNTLSTIELAKLIKNQTESNSEIKLIPFEEVYGHNFSEDSYRRPNLQRLNKYLDTEQFRGMDEIIEDMIDAYCCSTSSK